MPKRFKLKHYISNAFRELFLYHHSSLEFRAKLFATIIVADGEVEEREFDLVKEAGMKIYNDEDRSDTLVLTTREYVNKVLDNNGLDIDKLIDDIIKDLKEMPRYAKKIDIELLSPLLECHSSYEAGVYQERIIELFIKLKEEYGSV